MSDTDMNEPTLKEVAGRLDAIDAKLREIRVAQVARFRWSMVPILVVLFLWIVGFFLMFWHIDIWGSIDGRAWEAVVLRSVVISGALACLTAVSIAVMRRDW